MQLHLSEKLHPVTQQQKYLENYHGFFSSAIGAHWEKCCLSRTHIETSGVIQTVNSAADTGAISGLLEGLSANQFQGPDLTGAGLL